MPSRSSLRSMRSIAAASRNSQPRSSSSREQLYGSSSNLSIRSRKTNRRIEGYYDSNESDSNASSDEYESSYKSNSRSSNPYDSDDNSDSEGESNISDSYNSKSEGSRESWDDEDSDSKAIFSSSEDDESGDESGSSYYDDDDDESSSNRSRSRRSSSRRGSRDDEEDFDDEYSSSRSRSRSRRRSRSRSRRSSSRYDDDDDDDDDEYSSNRRRSSRRSRGGESDSSSNDDDYGSDSDDSNSNSNSDSSNSDDDDETTEQKKQDRVTKEWKIAFGLSCCCLILIAIGVGVYVGLFMNGDDAIIETEPPAPAPQTTPAITETAATIVPTAFTEFNSTDLNETMTNETMIDDDAFFNNSTSNVTNGTNVDDDAFESIGLDKTVPDNIALTPNGDSYVVTAGSEQGGKVISLKEEDKEIISNFPTFLVRSQNNAETSTSTALPDDYEDISSYALMNFYLGDYPWFNKVDLQNFDATAVICLEHVPDLEPNDVWGNLQSEDTIKEYSICRLKNTVEESTQQDGEEGKKIATGKDVEIITKGDEINYNMPNDCIDELTTTFSVSTTNTTICVDITSFVSDYPPFVPVPLTEDNEDPSRHRRYVRRRKLQEESDETTKTDDGGDAVTDVDPSKYKNMLFMIANIKKGQDASARFYSRQSIVNATSLFISMTQSTPTSSPGPTGPTGNIDTPAVDPTVVIGPPTATPTLPLSPTISPAPTFKAEYKPCGVCGNFPTFVPLSNFPLTIPIELSPPQVTKGTSTCAEFEDICQGGYCQPELCELLPSSGEFCGCLAPIYPICEICADNEILIKPDTALSLSSELSPTGEAQTMTCDSVEGICEAGFCNPELCSSAQDSPRCGCQPKPKPTATPTSSPAPTISPAPTFKAEFSSCSICGGDDPVDIVLNDIKVSVPDDIAPPQVTTGKATCTNLESYCQGGYCSPVACESVLQVADTCGCFTNTNSPTKAPLTPTDLSKTNSPVVIIPTEPPIVTAYPTCGICGPDNVLSIPDGILVLPPELVPLRVKESEVTCTELEELCQDGLCKKALCAEFPIFVDEACGCQSATDPITPVVGEVEAEGVTTLTANGDTYLFPGKDGDADLVGSKDTILIQNSDPFYPKSFGLVSFDTTDLVDTANLDIFTFCLEHQPTLGEFVYSTCIVPSPNDNNVETLTGLDADYKIPDSCVDGLVVEFDVSPSTETICIDVSTLFQESNVFATNNNNEIIFMIEDLFPSETRGVQFFSRSAEGGNAPELKLSSSGDTIVV